MGRCGEVCVEIATNLTPQVGAVKVDPGQLEQVVMNLAVNARDAMPQGGRLTLETADVEIDDAFVSRHPGSAAGPHVLLAVADTGSGMSPEVLARMFEPFFTTKPQGQGTGLGLSTVYGIVKQHGGYIAVESQPNRGTTFKICFPRVDAAAEETVEDKGSPRTTTARENGTILVVDDDRDVRELIREVLAPRGYTILEADSGSEALHVAEGHQGVIDLLLTDVVMPSTSGRELAERLAALRPETKVLYISGYTDDRLVHYGVLAERLQLLPKPFNPSQLILKIQAVLEPA